MGGQYPPQGSGGGGGGSGSKCVLSRSGQISTTSSSDTYRGPGSGNLLETIENRLQVQVPYAGTLRNYGFRITANSRVTNSTAFTVNLDGVNTALTVTVGTSASGKFLDDTNTVAVSAEQEISFVMAGDPATENIRIGGESVELEAS